MSTRFRIPGRKTTGYQFNDIFNRIEQLEAERTRSTAAPSSGFGTPSGLSGSGSIAHISRWTGATTLGDSHIQENGSKIIADMRFGNNWFIAWDELNGTTYGAFIGMTSGNIIEIRNSTGGEIKLTQSPSGTVMGSFTTSGLRMLASMYLNFGASAGSGGYGLRDNSGTMEYKNSGGAWTGFASTVSGSGTSGYGARWTGTSTLGNSCIQDDGSKVTATISMANNTWIEWFNSTGTSNQAGIGFNSGNYMQIYAYEIDFITDTNVGALTLYSDGSSACRRLTPFADNTYDLAQTGTRFKNFYCYDGYATNGFHTGDLMFTDKTCPNCGELFRKGQKLCLVVTDVDEKEIRTVPAHILCSHPKSKMNVPVS